MTLSLLGLGDPDEIGSSFEMKEQKIAAPKNTDIALVYRYARSLDNIVSAVAFFDSKGPLIFEDRRVL